MMPSLYNRIKKEKKQKLKENGGDDNNQISEEKDAVY